MLPQGSPVEQISCTLSVTEITERGRKRKYKAESRKEEAREQKETSERWEESNYTSAGESQSVNVRKRDVEL